MRLTPRTIVAMAGMLAASGCEVDPLDPAVQMPAHRAALAAAAGVVSPGAAVRDGRAVQVHQTDGGYVGAGAATDMDSFRPLTFSTCRAASCAPVPGTTAELTECRSDGTGSVTCLDRVDGTVEGRATFFPDQRFSLEATSGDLFVSGVWHQDAAQRARAARVFERMMTAFEASFGTNYARVSDDRNAVVDALAEIGGAGIGGAGMTPVPGAGAGGAAVPGSTAARNVTVRNGYNFGDRPYEEQSRQVAERYTCEQAQALPVASGASCEAFRSMVIIEACLAIIPPAAYNADQPQFLRVAEAFANEGSDLVRACGY